MPLMWLGWPAGTTGTVVAAAVVAGGAVVAVVVRLRSGMPMPPGRRSHRWPGHRKEVVR